MLRLYRTVIVSRFSHSLSREIRCPESQVQGSGPFLWDLTTAVFLHQILSLVLNQVFRYPYYKPIQKLKLQWSWFLQKWLQLNKRASEGSWECWTVPTFRHYLLQEQKTDPCSCSHPRIEVFNAARQTEQQHCYTGFCLKTVTCWKAARIMYFTILHISYFTHTLVSTLWLGNIFEWKDTSKFFLCVWRWIRTNVSYSIQ